MEEAMEEQKEREMEAAKESVEAAKEEVFCVFVLLKTWFSDMTCLVFLVSLVVASQSKGDVCVCFCFCLFFQLTSRNL